MENGPFWKWGFALSLTAQTPNAHLNEEKLLDNLLGANRPRIVDIIAIPNHGQNLHILSPLFAVHTFEMELNLMRMTWHCWYECDLQSKRGKKRKEIVIATERKLFERSVNFRSLRCHPDDNHIRSQRYFDWHFRIIIFMIVLRTWFIIGSLISRYNL